MSDNSIKTSDRLIVYTALFGDYDNLIDPLERFEGCDFVCFSDQKHLNSEIWEIRLVERHGLPANIMNRKYKILPHLFFPECEKSLYIDANIAILKNPKELSDKYLNQFNFVAPRHFARDCVYDEANECIILMKDKIENIKNQMQRYRKAGLPPHFGLSENNILLRKNLDKNVIALMESWWQELQKETKRDQLSLSYVMWKLGLKYQFMEESARQKEGYFSYCFHKDSINRSFLSKLKSKFIFEFRRFFIKW